MEENVDKEFEKKDNDTVAVVEVIPGISYQSKTAECMVSETMPCPLPLHSNTAALDSKILSLPPISSLPRPSVLGELPEQRFALSFACAVV